MKLYIVIKTDANTNLILDTIVCFTKEQANECLENKYNDACHISEILNLKRPTNCLDNDFFFWELTNMQIKFEIEESYTYA